MRLYAQIVVASCLVAAASPALAAPGECLRGRIGAAFERGRPVFTFCGDSRGWSGGFADLPANALLDPIYDLHFQRTRLPPSTGARGEGLRLAGSNRSDDLFMFVKRQLTGLQPDTHYSVGFQLRIATDAGAGCFGIGGAPGESVYVKAGATPAEPMAVPVDGDLRMNIDVGNQAQSGADAVVIAHVADEGADCEGGNYVIKAIDGRDSPVETTSDRDGNLWLIVGFDSAYEGISDLYIERIAVTVQRVQ
jgi:hypothetical protein